MYEKDGKFYADWRDRSGRRLRKSFTSKRAALKFEADQKELAHPKGKATGRRLQPCSSPKLMGCPATRRSIKLPNESSRRQVQKLQANSRLAMPLKSTTRSTGKVMPFPR